MHRNLPILALQTGPKGPKFAKPSPLLVTHLDQLSLPQHVLHVKHGGVLLQRAGQ